MKYFKSTNKMVFSLLPQECIFLIISFIIQSSPIRLRNEKNWKKVLTDSQIKYCSRAWSWRRPPFTSIFPLISCSKGMKDIFDTNEVWAYLYEIEFRNGQIFKRRPKDVKKRLLSKSIDIIRKRYEPILEEHKRIINTSRENLRTNLHQIHNLDIAFSKIRPQIPNRDNIDKNIDHIGVVMPTSIVLQEGYTCPSPWGNDQQIYGPIRLDVSTASHYIDQHRLFAVKRIESINESKKRIEEIEKIIN